MPEPAVDVGRAEASVEVQRAERRRLGAGTEGRVEVRVVGAERVRVVRAVDAQHRRRRGTGRSPSRRPSSPGRGPRRTQRSADQRDRSEQRSVLHCVGSFFHECSGGGFRSARSQRTDRNPGSREPESVGEQPADAQRRPARGPELRRRASERAAVASRPDRAPGHAARRSPPTPVRPPVRTRVDRRRLQARIELARCVAGRIEGLILVRPGP